MCCRRGVRSGGGGGLEGGYVEKPSLKMPKVVLKTSLKLCAYRPKGWEGQTQIDLCMSMVIISSRISWSWAILAGRSPLVELRGEDMGEAAAEAVAVILEERLKEDMAVMLLLWLGGLVVDALGGVLVLVCWVVRKEKEKKQEAKGDRIYISSIRSQIAHYLGFFVYPTVLQRLIRTSTR